jgi:Na+-translocating ferredoxin:NAD+ oxidoreductase subunit G
MSDILKISTKLALICAVAALALGSVNTVTAPKIADYKLEQLQQALSAVSAGYEVSPQSIPVGEGQVRNYYELQEDGEAAGYILEMTASGYGGPMDLIIGYRADGSVIHARLLQNAETPGLGKEAEKDSYMEMFAGTGADAPVPVKKGDLPSEIADSVSGATITFSGIAQAAAAGSAFVRNLDDRNN